MNVLLSAIAVLLSCQAFIKGICHCSGVGFMNNPIPNTQRPRFVQTHVEVSSPYSGWKLYFPDEG